MSGKFSQNGCKGKIEPATTTGKADRRGSATQDVLLKLQVARQWLRVLVVNRNAVAVSSADRKLRPFVHHNAITAVKKMFDFADFIKIYDCRPVNPCKSLWIQLGFNIV
jgi:hypothetical protein